MDSPRTPARHNSIGPVGPGHQERVVDHDAAPGEPGPADGLGRDDLHEHVEVAGRRVVRDGDPVRHAARAGVLGITDGGGGVADLAGDRSGLDVGNGGGEDGRGGQEGGGGELEEAHGCLFVSRT